MKEFEAESIKKIFRAYRAEVDNDFYKPDGFYIRIYFRNRQFQIKQSSNRLFYIFEVGLGEHGCNWSVLVKNKPATYLLHSFLSEMGK